MNLTMVFVLFYFSRYLTKKHILNIDIIPPCRNIRANSRRVKIK